MWLFWTFEGFGFLVVLVGIVIFCRVRKQGFWAFIWKHLKWIVLAVIIVWILIAIICRHHLYEATHCYFRGKSMKAQTKYSIFLSECQIETPRGSFVPIEKSRALPDGNHAPVDSNDNDEYYGY